MVDPVIPDFELRSFDAATDTTPDFPYSYKSLQTTTDIADDGDGGDDGGNDVLQDNSRGLFRVWYLLLDGLTSAVVNCPRGYQSLAVDTLFEIFNSIQKQVRLIFLIKFYCGFNNNMFVIQGCEGNGDPHLTRFGLYCTNHLLLPMLQSWLRRCQRTFQGWLASGPNFKHCMGRTTELVMNWLKMESKESNNHRHEKSQTLALKQTLLVLIECTVVPVDSIARLGCSCLR